VVYFPGYGYYPGGLATRRGSVRGDFQGADTTVELPRLGNRQERLKVVGSLPPSTSIPDEKIPKLLRLINIERVDLGLQPIPFPRGK
jgi:hypothetical protein